MIERTTVFNGDSAFENIAAFYMGRTGEHSGEMDFGVWWTDGEARWPSYRVSVVHATGDVYAINTTRASGVVLLLGTVAHNGNDRCPIDGPCTDDCAYRAAEAALVGWTDHIHELGSLRWVRARLRDYGRAPKYDR